MTTDVAPAGVRGRYAPSPTGYLTVGNARTALLAWLDVRSRGGSFVLRLDDTDVARETVAPDEIRADLDALGLDWDEGWDVGGPCAPYATSERAGRHRAVADELLASGAAYWDYTPPIADVAAHKAGREGAKAGRSAHRGSSRQVEGVDPVLRLRVPADGAVEVHDRVFGAIRVDVADIAEVALMRADGRPTYHLASCVDDAEMGITSVVRGADWLNSLPQHALVFRALGADLPEFAHVPLLVGADGQKLSKRQGDLSIRHLLDDEGVPGGALCAYLANLGFAERTDLEALAEMANGFDLALLGKASPRYDPKKLEALSRRWLAECESPERLAAELRSRAGIELTEEQVRVLVEGVRTRIPTFAAAGALAGFLGIDDRGGRDVAVLDDDLVAALLGTRPWEVGALAAAIDAAVPAGPDRKASLGALRDALAPGLRVTPPLHVMLAALGRERSAARLAPGA
ncbi:MAG: glutamate--tRNA ligase family protein [Acidimicrobiia bacterium]